jgi:hypothetical protein
MVTATKKLPVTGGYWFFPVIALARVRARDGAYTRKGGNWW